MEDRVAEAQQASSSNQARLEELQRELDAELLRSGALATEATSLSEERAKSAELGKALSEAQASAGALEARLRELERRLEGERSRAAALEEAVAEAKEDAAAHEPLTRALEEARSHAASQAERLSELEARLAASPSSSSEELARERARADEANARCAQLEADADMQLKSLELARDALRSSEDDRRQLEELRAEDLAQFRAGAQQAGHELLEAHEKIARLEKAIRDSAQTTVEARLARQEADELLRALIDRQSDVEIEHRAREAAEEAASAAAKRLRELLDASTERGEALNRELDAVVSEKPR